VDRRGGIRNEGIVQGPGLLRGGRLGLPADGQREGGGSGTRWRGKIDALSSLKAGDSACAAHAAPLWLPASPQHAKRQAPGLTPAPQAFPLVGTFPPARRYLT